MSTMGTRSKSSALLAQDRADALEVAAVADDDQVGLEVGLGGLSEAIDLRHEVVHRRHRVGADGVDAGAEALERQGHGRAQNRVHRPRGSRDRRS